MARRTALFATCLFAIGCRAATQVTVELTTDVACGEKPATEARVGRLGRDLETRPTSVATTACAPTGQIGSFVVVPSGGPGDEVAVKVGAAHGRTVDSCPRSEPTAKAFPRPI